jgi:SSS family solute:Na+ symporter
MPPFEGVFSFFWNPVISCVSTLVMANLFRFVFPNRAEVTAKEKA